MDGGRRLHRGARVAVGASSAACRSSTFGTSTSAKRYARRAARHGGRATHARPPHPGHQPGGVCIHAAHRRRPAVSQLRADTRRRTGLQPGDVLTARVAPPDHATRKTRSGEPQRAAARTRRAIPGVRQAALTRRPVRRDNSDSVILAEGYQMAPGESLISPYQISVSHGYFETMGIALNRGGRSPTATPNRAKVMIVDESWRSSSGAPRSVGRRMYQARTRRRPASRRPHGALVHRRRRRRQHADVRAGGSRRPRRRVLLPDGQDPRAAMALAVRTAGDPLALGRRRPASHRDVDPGAARSTACGRWRSGCRGAGRSPDADAPGDRRSRWWRCSSRRSASTACWLLSVAAHARDRHPHGARRRRAADLPAGAR